jgi:hypothetical protein
VSRAGRDRCDASQVADHPSNRTAVRFKQTAFRTCVSAIPQFPIIISPPRGNTKGNSRGAQRRRNANGKHNGKTESQKPDSHLWLAESPRATGQKTRLQSTRGPKATAYAACSMLRS